MAVDYAVPSGASRTSGRTFGRDRHVSELISGIFARRGTIGEISARRALISESADNWATSSEISAAAARAERGKRRISPRPTAHKHAPRAYRGVGAPRRREFHVVHGGPQGSKGRRMSVTGPKPIKERPPPRPSIPSTQGHRSHGGDGLAMSEGGVRARGARARARCRRRLRLGPSIGRGPASCSGGGRSPGS
jgi:hypothetical protein